MHKTYKFNTNFVTKKQIGGLVYPFRRSLKSGHGPRSVINIQKYRFVPTRMSADKIMKNLRQYS